MRVVFRSPYSDPQELWRVMSWLHANSIPFLVRKKHTDNQNRLSPRFIAPRAMMFLLVPILTGRVKLRMPWTRDGLPQYEFKIRERDAAVFRLRYTQYREIGLTDRLLDYVRQAAAEQVVREIIGK